MWIISSGLAQRAVQRRITNVGERGGSSWVSKASEATCSTNIYYRGATTLLVATLQLVVNRWSRKLGTYCSSFQLMHMSRGDHARVDRVSNGVQREDKKLLQCYQLRQHGEFWHVSVVIDSDHGCVVRIYIGPSWDCTGNHVKESDRAMAANSTSENMATDKWRF